MAHRVTFIPGDGTGPEIADATKRVLDATGVGFEWDVQEAGVDIMKTAGTPLPDSVIEYLKAQGGILWEPGKEDREGWAICPCCGRRELHIVVEDEDNP